MFLLYFDGKDPLNRKKCTACSFGTSLFQSKMPKSDGPQTSQTYLIFGWQAKTTTGNIYRIFTLLNVEIIGIQTLQSNGMVHNFWFEQSRKLLLRWATIAWRPFRPCVPLIMWRHLKDQTCMAGPEHTN